MGSSMIPSNSGEKYSYIITMVLAVIVMFSALRIFFTKCPII